MYFTAKCVIILVNAMFFFSKLYCDHQQILADNVYEVAPTPNKFIFFVPQLFVSVSDKLSIECI